MPDFFYWTGDDDSSDEPQWMVDALADGRVTIENPGPGVYLLVNGKRFDRGSLITRRDVEG